MEYPRQAIPFSEKTEEWGKKNIDYLISISSFGSGAHTIHKEIQKCYDAYEGRLDTRHYVHVLKPFGEKTPQNITSPANIKSFNIIKFIVDLLHGDYMERPKIATVIATNADVETLRLEAYKKALLHNMQQRYINNLNAQGIDTGQDSQEVESLQKLAEKYSRATWKDLRAMTGQLSLDFIIQDNEVHAKFKKGFLDFLISGFVYTLKEPNSNEIDYTVLDSRDVDHDRNPDLDFVEDGEWALVRQRTTLSQIVDTYHDDLKDNGTIQELEEANTYNYGSELFLERVTRGFQDIDRNNVEVIRVFWKSRKKIGFVSYTDEFGKLQEMEVDETYKQQEGEEVEWVWVNEVWEGTRIAGKYYVRIRPVLAQRTSIDNPSKCKLPINGRSYYSRTPEQFSLVSIGIPFQVTYNIYKWRLESSIAKNKDKILQLDINAKPKDWPLEDWLAYAQNLGYLVVDYKNYTGNNQHQAQIDLSFSQYLSIHLELLDSLVLEWMRLAGVPPQRLGQIHSTETVGGVERAVNQSALTTEVYNDLFQHFEQREYNGLLDVSKYTWIDGKKSWYFLPEYGNLFLDVDGIKHAETNYAVFVSNSSKDYNKLNTIKQLGERMLQSNVPASAVIEILDSENMSLIKQKIRDAEAAQQAMQMQMQEQEQAALTQIEEKRLAIEQDKLNRDDRNKELDRENKLQVAAINAFSKQDGLDSDGDGEPDPIEIANLAIDKAKLTLDAQIANKKLDLEQKKLVLTDKKLEVDREKMASQEKVAKFKAQEAKNKPKPSSKK